MHGCLHFPASLVCLFAFLLLGFSGHVDETTGSSPGLFAAVPEAETVTVTGRVLYPNRRGDLREVSGARVNLYDYEWSVMTPQYVWLAQIIMENLVRVPKGGTVKSHWLIVLVALTLVACSQGGSSSGRGDCADGVCVALRVVEPVQYNAAVVVKITVTSEQDRSDLGVTLCGGGGGSQATIDGPQGWESNARKGLVWNDGSRDCANWSFAAKANVPVQFTRVLRFSEKDQLADVDAALHIPPRSYVAGASAQIRYSRGGVQVYGMGTPRPGPTRLSDQTSPWITWPNGTRIPAPTLLPTPTFAPRTRPPTPNRPPYP